MSSPRNFSILRHYTFDKIIDEYNTWKSYLTLLNHDEINYESYEYKENVERKNLLKLYFKSLTNSTKHKKSTLLNFIKYKDWRDEKDRDLLNYYIRYGGRDINFVVGLIDDGYNLYRVHKNQLYSYYIYIFKYLNENCIELCKLFIDRGLTMNNFYVDNNNELITIQFIYVVLYNFGSQHMCDPRNYNLMCQLLNLLQSNNLILKDISNIQLTKQRYYNCFHHMFKYDINSYKIFPYDYSDFKSFVDRNIYFKYINQNFVTQ